MAEVSVLIVFIVLAVIIALYSWWLSIHVFHIIQLYVSRKNKETLGCLMNDHEELDHIQKLVAILSASTLYYFSLQIISADENQATMVSVVCDNALNFV
jgi:hypothetical protein